MDERTKVLLQRAVVAGLAVLVLTLLADQELWLAAVSAVAAAFTAWRLRPTAETWIAVGGLLVVGMLVVGFGAEVAGRVIVAAALGAVWPLMMDVIGRDRGTRDEAGRTA